MKALWEIGGAFLIVVVLIGTPVAVFAGDRYLNTAPETYTIVAHVAEDGGFVPNQITVVQGVHARLRLTSADVVHGFAVSGLGINVAEVYPGKYSTVDFTPTKPGTYPFTCTVLCSIQHYKMQGTIVVVSANGGPIPMAPTTSPAADSPMPGMVMPPASQSVTEKTSAPVPAASSASLPSTGDSGSDVAAGERAFQTNCASCHGANAAGGLKLGSATSADLRWSSLGATYSGDRSLIRRAILTGQDQSGQNLDPTMPRWQGTLSDADANAIIAYLATGPSPSASASGAAGQ